MNLWWWRRPRISVKRFLDLFGIEQADWQSDYRRREAADSQEKEMLAAYKRYQKGKGQPPTSGDWPS